MGMWSAAVLKIAAAAISFSFIKGQPTLDEGACLFPSETLTKNGVIALGPDSAPRDSLKSIGSGLNARNTVSDSTGTYYIGIAGVVGLSTTILACADHSNEMFVRMPRTSGGLDFGPVRVLHDVYAFSCRNANGPIPGDNAFLENLSANLYCVPPQTKAPTSGNEVGRMKRRKKDK